MSYLVFGDIMTTSRSPVWWTWKAPCRKDDTTLVTRCKFQRCMGPLIHRVTTVQQRGHNKKPSRGFWSAAILFPNTLKLGKQNITEHLPGSSTLFLPTFQFFTRLLNTSMHSSRHCTGDHLSPCQAEADVLLAAFDLGKCWLSYWQLLLKYC